MNISVYITELNVAVSPKIVGYSLHPSYPNPFNPVTHITYGIPKSTNVELIVYDIQGRQIEELKKGFQTAGHNVISWNASMHPSGVYLIRMNTDEFTKSQKVMLMLIDKCR